MPTSHAKAVVTGYYQYYGVPEKYYKDRILRKNLCPINRVPIRTPFKTPDGHVYEENDLKMRIQVEEQEKKQFNCLMTGKVITIGAGVEDTKFDPKLSDEIELRLLLLTDLPGIFFRVAYTSL